MYKTLNADVAKEVDFQAVDRFKAGDAKAFDELVVRYEGKMYGFLMRMCGCADRAQDVVQETFMTAYRYLNGFRGDASFKTWLYRIASTSCMKNKRRRKNEPARHVSLDDLVPGEAEIKGLTDSSWPTTPAEELLNRELAAHIQNSLLELPEKYRIVFVLRDVEGFSAEEAARTLKITVPAVKSRLHRARLFLRKKLSSYYLGGQVKKGRAAKKPRRN